MAHRSVAKLPVLPAAGWCCDSTDNLCCE